MFDVSVIMVLFWLRTWLSRIILPLHGTGTAGCLLLSCAGRHALSNRPLLLNFVYLILDLLHKHIEELISLIADAKGTLVVEFFLDLPLNEAGIELFLILLLLLI